MMVDMKYIFVLYALAIFGIGGCATVPSVPEAPRVIEETVRSRIDSFRRNIKIEISKHDQARIKNVYLEHQHKKKKTGEKDYLYVNGSIKNTSIPIISGIAVVAEFLDSTGNIIATEHDDIIPRIVGRHGARKGYFTIKTDYNPDITQCRLKLSWYGQDE